ncbi:hypothetical protein GNP81_16410 [Aliivibrio fischeri]|jgi:hypothetical protein|uniref:DUF3800 domain-containing protein n=1 Tax=Aliivibrio fischeri TaxID=668 RepID=UPI0012D9C51C|nr:DUF3800 domain-containing protein [Aliivibrio fischeri]MUK62710.1 hypothetical protein [Aliivibrio fischeri]MUL22390.1 hypothetical protein [Aliivibrio fischeri]MUL26181.1 hypothetical protein [Aliivibrio fischeri]
MELESTKNKYSLYYDESNNIRKLLLSGAEYNIDNDPSQESSSIFVLGGIALNDQSKEIDFIDLKNKLYLPKKTVELKFAQMVKIRAKYTPIEAFKYALGSKKFKTLFEFFLEKNVYIHYEMINTVYWSFLDIIEDLVLCTDDINDYSEQFIYKDCLYRLIKLDKENFLALMTSFDYPRIEKKHSLRFLESLHELILNNIAKKFSNNESDLDSKMLFKLGYLVYKCIHLFSEKVDFELVFQFEKNVLIDDFSLFYMNRLKMFPNSKHILDNEEKVEEMIQKIRVHDSEIDNIDFVFVESEEEDNYLVQISDVTSGFIKLFFNFLEYASIEDVNRFIASLNPLQKQTMSLFKDLLDKSIEECHIFLHRVVVPIDEHKASILLNGKI